MKKLNLLLATTAILSTGLAMSVKAEVGMYPTLENIEYELPLKIEKDVKKTFMLPCSFEPETFKFGNFEAFYLLKILMKFMKIIQKKI